MLKRYDAVVIGSGIGGLTCGAFLARAGMRVLVLEKHADIGGYAHSFKRERHLFECGIHSVPMADSGMVRHLLGLLGVDNMIETIELPVMFNASTPEYSFTMPGKKEEIERALNDSFPKERRNLVRLFDDMRDLNEKIIRPIFDFERSFVEEDQKFVSRFHNLSYQNYIEKFFSDKNLQFALFSQWPYGGASPDFGPSLFYIMMFLIHYLDGSHSLKGGFSSLVGALAHAITGRGGEIKTNSEVSELVVRGKNAASVKTVSGEEFEAGVFISNISPYILHNKLIPKEERNRRWQRRLSNLNPSVSAVAVYLGLNRDISDIMENNTVFWFSSRDNKKIFRNILNNRHETLNHIVFLRSAVTSAPPTLTMLYYLKKSASDRWKTDKMLFAERIMSKAEQLYPGLKEAVDFIEVGSPDTFQRYTDNTGGALYGFENTKRIYGEAKMPVTTHLSNLFQTGHWGKPGCGVWNVMVNGYQTYHTAIRNGATTVPASRGKQRTTTARNIRLRFVYPKFKKFLEGHDELNTLLKKYLVGNYTMPPSLALPIIAALTPDDIEINLTDDNIGQEIDYDENVDLAAISCFTPQASRAYAIADEYRKKGTKVILGGIHPTALPEEALRHADAVCIGEAEPVWPEILNDIKNGELKKTYRSNKIYQLSKLPIPKREIFKQGIYNWNAHLVLTTRGCPVKCEGCPIPEKEGYLLRLRPVDDIIEDIKLMPYREFYFTDDTIMLPGKKNMKFLLSIMERTRELDVSIFLASTMMMVSDPAFYRELKRGGAASMYTVFGFDRVSRNLFSRECTRKEWKKCVDLVRTIEDAGIHFFASFGIGFDDQDSGVFDKILGFAEESGIDLAEFYITTPFPGTPFGKRIEKEMRILQRNYDYWNHGNIVFKPRNFTEKELMDGFYYLWKAFYKNKDPVKTIRTFDVSE